jgi:diadenosine tetraphosphate (Ap4A) HIT family hydrolase
VSIFSASGIPILAQELDLVARDWDQDLLHLHLHVVPCRVGDNFKLPDPTIEELSEAERGNQAAALRHALAKLPMPFA